MDCGDVGLCGVELVGLVCDSLRWIGEDYTREMEELSVFWNPWQMDLTSKVN